MADRAKQILLRKHSPLVSLAIAWCAAAALGQNGLPYHIKAPEGSVQFGRSVASGGDANGDGVDDLFVSDPAFEVEGVRVGRWFVFDGATRRVIWSAVGDSRLYPDHVGHSHNIVAAFVGDIDRDGCDDLALGRPSALELFGIADVLSGRTGERLHRFEGTALKHFTGVDVAGVGDLNGDGTPDFAVVRIYYYRDGLVTFHSGVDGSELLRVQMPFPRRVRGIGDIDGDGHDDAAICSYNQNDPHINIVSGRSGAITRLNPPTGASEMMFGYALAGGRDVTGDGVPDLATRGGGLVRPQTIYLFSGADLTLVRTYAGDDRAQFYGLRAEFADLNGEGEYEIVIGDDYGPSAHSPRAARSIWRTALPFVDEVGYGNEFAVGDFNADGRADVAGPSGRGGVMLYGGGPLLLSLREHRPDFNIVPAMTYDLEIVGARPGRRIHLLGSLSGNGCTFVPRLGICIDLDQRIHRLGSAIAEPDRTARFTLEASPNLPRGPLWLQAIDPSDPGRGAITSNVMRLEVVD